MVTAEPVPVQSRLVSPKAILFYSSLLGSRVFLAERFLFDSGLANLTAGDISTIFHRLANVSILATYADMTEALSSSQVWSGARGRPAVLLIEDSQASTTSESVGLGESSTAEQTEYAEPLNETAFRAFLESAKDKCDEEDFDGLDDLLTGFVSENAASGIVAIAVAADQGEIGPLNMVEVMRLLGRWNSSESRNARSWLMKRFLSHPSAAVRDGALIGLLLLEDSSAIPLLEKAVAVEPVSELRRELERGLDYLRSL